MEIEEQNSIQKCGKMKMVKLAELPITWQNAALRFGEELSTSGPNGYYKFTPEEWLNYALNEWKALTVGITILKECDKKHTELKAKEGQV